MKTLYRDEIHTMNENELLEALNNYNIVTAMEVEDMDSDTVIELIEAEHGEIFECREHDILDTIYNGNWTCAVKQMQDTNQGYMFPSQIADYIEDYRYENDSEAFEWFNLSSMSALCDCFYAQREQVRRVG